jgi:hypothetical protein
MAKMPKGMQNDSGGATDALREAVERTFTGVAAGAAGAPKKAGELFDDVASLVRGAFPAGRATSKSTKTTASSPRASAGKEG